MGIPKFFHWISKRYPLALTLADPNAIPSFDNLYLDMNGIIHACSHPNDADVHFRLTEEILFNSIFKYIDHLVRIVRPTGTFLLAVDGVAPRAKMNQQRARRFRSARDAAERREMAIRRGETLPKQEPFDTNCITPGTVFMEKLTRHLIYFLSYKLNTDAIYQGMEKILLSSHEVPGEGEHKIMEYIRTRIHEPDYDPKTRHCIYGLDADLIMLGLTTGQDNFALLREEVKFNSSSSSSSSNNKYKSSKQGSTILTLSQGVDVTKTKFFLLQLGLVREYLCKDFYLHGDLTSEDQVDNEDFYGHEKSILDERDFEKTSGALVNDFIFLSILVGNDFIPHLPHLHINAGAYQFIFDAYKRAMLSFYADKNRDASDFFCINRNGSIRWDQFALVCEQLRLDYEQKIFDSAQADLNFYKSRRGGGAGNSAAPGAFKITPHQRGYVEVVKRYVYGGRKKHSGVDGDQFLILSLADELNRDNDTLFLEQLAKDLNLVVKEKTPSALVLSNENYLFFDDDDDDGDNDEQGNDEKSSDDDEQSEMFDRIFVKYDLATIIASEDQRREAGASPFDLWKARYYEEKFQVPAMSSGSSESVDGIARSYLKALEWVIKYYYEGVADWSYFYPYHYSPFISDICNLLGKQARTLQFKFNLGVPFQPFEQLMGVLPAASKALIPSTYHALMDEQRSVIGDFYPRSFDLDLNGKKNDWEAIVLIPFIEEDRLLRAMREAEARYPLSADEVKRNRRGDWLLISFNPARAPYYCSSSLKRQFPDIVACKVDVKAYYGIHINGRDNNNTASQSSNDNTSNSNGMQNSIISQSSNGMQNSIISQNSNSSHKTATLTFGEVGTLKKNKKTNYEAGFAYLSLLPHTSSLLQISSSSGNNGNRSRRKGGPSSSRSEVLLLNLLAHPLSHLTPPEICTNRGLQHNGHDLIVNFPFPYLYQYKCKSIIKEGIEYPCNVGGGDPIALTQNERDKIEQTANSLLSLYERQYGLRFASSNSNSMILKLVKVIGLTWQPDGSQRRIYQDSSAEVIAPLELCIIDPKLPLEYVESGPANSLTLLYPMLSPVIVMDPGVPEHVYGQCGLVSGYHGVPTQRGSVSAACVDLVLKKAAEPSLSKLVTQLREREEEEGGGGEEKGKKADGESTVYLPSFTVAQKYSFHPLFLSKIMSAFLVKEEEEGQEQENEGAGAGGVKGHSTSNNSMVNLGLTVKADQRKQYREGYARCIVMNGKNITQYSERCINILCEYKNQFPEAFDKLCEQVLTSANFNNNNGGNNGGSGGNRDHSYPTLDRASIEKMSKFLRERGFGQSTNVQVEFSGKQRSSSFIDKVKGESLKELCEALSSTTTTPSTSTSTSTTTSNNALYKVPVRHLIGPNHKRNPIHVLTAGQNLRLADRVALINGGGGDCEFGSIGTVIGIERDTSNNNGNSNGNSNGKNSLKLVKKVFVLLDEPCLTANFFNENNAREASLFIERKSNNNSTKEEHPDEDSVDNVEDSSVVNRILKYHGLQCDPIDLIKITSPNSSSNSKSERKPNDARKSNDKINAAAKGNNNNNNGKCNVSYSAATSKSIKPNSNGNNVAVKNPGVPFEDPAIITAKVVGNSNGRPAYNNNTQIAATNDLDLISHNIMSMLKIKLDDHPGAPLNVSGGGGFVNASGSNTSTAHNNTTVPHNNNGEASNSTNAAGKKKSRNRRRNRRRRSKAQGNNNDGDDGNGDDEDGHDDDEGGDEEGEKNTLVNESTANANTSAPITILKKPQPQVVEGVLSTSDLQQQQNSYNNNNRRFNSARPENTSNGNNNNNRYDNRPSSGSTSNTGNNSGNGRRRPNTSNGYKQQQGQGQGQGRPNGNSAFAFVPLQAVLKKNTNTNANGTNANGNNQSNRSNNGKDRDDGKSDQ